MDAAERDFREALLRLVRARGVKGALESFLECVETELADPFDDGVGLDAYRVVGPLEEAIREAFGE